MYGYTDDTTTEVATSTDGAHRAVILPDPDREHPDGEGYGYIMRRVYYPYGAYRWETVHADPVDGDQLRGARAAGELANRLTDAHAAGETYGTPDGDPVETALARAAVDWHYFRSHVDQSGEEWLAVVTADHLAAWGCDPETVDQPARGAAAEWQAWLDGDVYAVEIQRRVTWSPDVDDMPDRDTWETVDTVGGYYGEPWAVESARAMLAEHTGA